MSAAGGPRRLHRGLPRHRLDRVARLERVVHQLRKLRLRVHADPAEQRRCHRQGLEVGPNLRRDVQGSTTTITNDNDNDNNDNNANNRHTPNDNILL